MNTLLIFLPPLAILAVMYGLGRLYQHWLSLPRPDDIPQIKAKLEANQHRVVDIRPAGFERGSLGRSGSHMSFRKYRALVSSPLGGPDEVHVVGIQAGLLAMRGVREYGAPSHSDFTNLP